MLRYTANNGIHDMIIWYTANNSFHDMIDCNGIQYMLWLWYIANNGMIWYTAYNSIHAFGLHFRVTETTL